MSVQDSIPEFARAWQGYDRAEVDSYLRDLQGYSVALDDRVRSLEAALGKRMAELTEVRRELVAASSGGGVPERLAEILRLANEEAREIRSQARTDADRTIQQAEEDSRRLFADAQQQLAAIEEHVRELVATRDGFVEGLVRLGEQVACAIDFQRSAITPAGSGARGDARATADEQPSPDDDAQPEDAAATVPISAMTDTATVPISTISGDAQSTTH